MWFMLSWSMFPCFHGLSALEPVTGQRCKRVGLGWVGRWFQVQNTSFKGTKVTKSNRLQLVFESNRLQMDTCWRVLVYNIYVSISPSVCIGCLGMISLACWPSKEIEDDLRSTEK